MNKLLQGLRRPTRLNHKFYMLCFALAVVSLSFNKATAAEKAVPPKKASSLNTQVYEKEDEFESFTDEVSLMREMAGEFQVKFKGKPGFYRLQEGDEKHQNLLAKALKTKKSVSIKAQKDSKIIQDVGFDGI